MMRKQQLIPLGIVACAGYAVHAGYYYRTGELELMLWVCHVSALLVGIGLITRSPLINAVGFFGAAIGFPTWLLYLFGGGEFFPTSLGTHVVGFAVGLLGVRALGVPKSTWWAAVLYIAAMMIVSRILTSREANVNLAFGPDTDLSLWSVTGPLHWALLLGQWALAFAALQFVLIRVFGTPESIQPPGSERSA